MSIQEIKSTEEFERLAQRVTGKFWLSLEKANRYSLYQCKSEKLFGRNVYFKKFAGWKDNWGQRKLAIRCSLKDKRWECFNLASEMSRTDYKVHIISNELKLLLSQRTNYHRIYKNSKKKK